MHTDYSDITDRIAAPPDWHDEHAVPQWGDFAPDRCANIYADEAALAEVACQGYGATFRVAFTHPTTQRGDAKGKGRIAEAIKAAVLEYGDPPNVGCCAAGPTMNSVAARVLEYWSRHHVGPDGRVADVVGHMTWRRDTALEVAIAPAWAGG